MQSINRAERRRSRRELAKRPQWGTLEEFARGQDSELAPGCAGGRGHRVARPGLVGAASGGGCASGIPQRPRQDAALIDDGRHDRSEATASAGPGATLREQSSLPLFVRRTEAVSELLPQLYLHGLAQEISSWRCADCSATVRRSPASSIRAAAGEVATGVRGRREAGGWTISK